MGRFLVGFVGLVLMTALTTSRPALAGPAAWVEDELLVGLRAGVARVEAERLYGDHGAAIADEIPAIRVHVIRVPITALAAIERSLSRRPEIAFVERNGIVPPDAVPNDPSYAQQWHLPKISAPAAWDRSLGGGQTIAILDSGADPSHPDLAGKLLPGFNFFDDTTDTTDRSGHGTMVAGAAAAIAGNATGGAAIAWDSAILPVRVTNLEGGGYYSLMAKGLVWAADRGARVVNLSFAGVAASSTVRSAAEYARGKGGVVVASAGNCGCDDPTAENPAVISVGATDSSDRLASFSSRREHVDLSAPGASILTTLRGGTYGKVSGTSFASPIVGGVVALMIAANPALGPDEIEEILQATAVDLGTMGWDGGFGFGRVDAAHAVAAAIAANGSTPIDSMPPAVSIATPASGASVSGTVQVAIDAVDDVGVRRVELLVDEVPVASTTISPAIFAWDTTAFGEGAHVLRALAEDAAGNRGSSGSVTVTVRNAAPDETPPVVTILSPSEGESVGKSVKVRIGATDDVQVRRIELSVDGVAVGAASCTASSCAATIAWNASRASKGAHRLEAHALDAAGNGASSGPRTVFAK